MGVRWASVYYTFAIGGQNVRGTCGEIPHSLSAMGEGEGGGENKSHCPPCRSVTNATAVHHLPRPPASDTLMEVSTPNLQQLGY